MAYKIIWSPAARDDLHDIVVFIAQDNPNRAMPFGYELISETDRLQEFPSLQTGLRATASSMKYRVRCRDAVTEVEESSDHKIMNYAH